MAGLGSHHFLTVNHSIFKKASYSAQEQPARAGKGKHVKYIRRSRRARKYMQVIRK